MYQLDSVPFGPYTKLTLHNPRTGHGFSVAPEAGANVLDILFDGKSILDGFQTPDELTEGKWGKSTLLFPFPNRLRDGQYEWGGKAYQFPINNAATQNAIHGFVRDEAFEVVEHHVGVESGHLTLAYNYTGHHEFYPFPFRFEITFSIGDNRRFGVATKVANTGEGGLPFGFGWHPYFRLTDRADDHQLSLSPCARVLIDDRMIPTGEMEEYFDFQQLEELGDRSLDTCFVCVDDAEDTYQLALSGGGRTLRLNARASEFPYFQVFTPPHRTSIALEPMTGNVDVLNNADGLVILLPSEVWEGQFELTID